MSEEKLNLLEFTSCLMAQAGTCSAQIMGSKPCQAPARGSLSNNRPNHFGVKPFPHVRPTLLMALNSGPEVSPADAVHSSIAFFTHSGIGTVRM